MFIYQRVTPSHGIKTLPCVLQSGPPESHVLPAKLGEDFDLSLTPSRSSQDLVGKLPTGWN